MNTLLNSKFKYSSPNSFTVNGSCLKVCFQEESMMDKYTNTVEGRNKGSTVYICNCYKDILSFSLCFFIY